MNELQVTYGVFTRIEDETARLFNKRRVSVNANVTDEYIRVQITWVAEATIVSHATEFHFSELPELTVEAICQRTAEQAERYFNAYADLMAKAA